MQIMALIISTVALATSVTTAWLTLFRRGTVKMTRPSTIYFGPDGASHADGKPKIYLRTLLFCTSKRGRIIETMHASLRQNESRQNFNIWVIGDERLTRGSGAFVGESGIVANHHFLTPSDGNSFEFRAGTYQLEVFAKLLNEGEHRLLFSQSLIVDAEQAAAIAEPRNGLYFDWGPDAGRYFSHIRASTEIRPDEIQELFRTFQTVLKTDKRAINKEEVKSDV